MPEGGMASRTVIRYKAHIDRMGYRTHMTQDMAEMSHKETGSGGGKKALSERSTSVCKY